MGWIKKIEFANGAGYIEITLEADLAALSEKDSAFLLNITNIIQDLLQDRGQ